MNRRELLLSLAGTVVAGCAGSRVRQPAGFLQAAPLAPLNLDPSRLVRITVCSRPFRPAGPRLEAEPVDGKTLVHNYGHGGSGWSLSWGCAAEATALALASAPQSVAVVGAGAIGLTTALRLVETGIGVTLYARDFPMETRSARATGLWSPSSRIGLANAVDAAFADRWEAWARSSFAAHQRFVGALGEPVEYLPQYALSDDSAPPGVPAKRDYLHLDRRIYDMIPGWSDVSAGAHPFPVPRARSGLNLTFNVASYAQTIWQEFLARGGRMLRREFPDRTALLALPERVIVNCTGIGAKSLFEDTSLVPVRGQINWLAAQPEARYALHYHEVFAVSRRDGLVVQYTGPNDDWGYGDDNEVPDREETADALARLAPLFQSKTP